MVESKMYMIPLPISPSVNWYTAKARIKAVITNFIFLLNMFMTIFEVRKGNKNKEFNFIFCFKTEVLQVEAKVSLNSK